MKRIPPSPSRDQAVAIVIVLSMIVLLTTLVIAFLSRSLVQRQLSDGSANSVKAEFLAQSAMQMIVGDLKQEIVSSSEPVYSGGGSSGETVGYNPKKVGTRSVGMLPWKSGVPTSTSTGDVIPNLLRRSVSSVGGGGAPEVPYPSEYTNPPVNLASTANSETPSLNKKFVSRTRWNSHYLMPRQYTGSDDAEPVASFQAPDWIYVTRDTGPKAVTDVDISNLKNTSSPDYAVGRYAYTIFDTGGLLDANLSGYPNSISANDLGRKGYISFAELTAIKKHNQTAAAFTQVDINKIVGWRNFATLRASGNLSSGYSWDALAPEWFRDYLTKTKTGFMTVEPGVYASRTNQMFTTRQALISFQQASGMSVDALQYLTTFSRDLNAPSWSPKNPTPLPFQTPFPTLAIDYEAHAKMERASAVISQPRNIDTSTDPKKLNGTYISPIPNRQLLGAVWQTDRTVIDWDGNPLTVKRGTPIVGRRFPLSRLSLLSDYEVASAADKPAIARKIKYSFGLVPDTATGAPPNGWVYDSYVYTTPNLFRLYTVDEMDLTTAPTGSVNFEHRELNFFELLRAGILRGEVGNWDVQDDDRDAAITIIRIGANIIDQYDENSFPTYILLNPTGGSFPYLNGMQIAGIENLPYLSEVIPRVYRKPTALGNDAERTKVSMWLEFELWNPHSNAASPGPGSPTEFRIAAMSGQGYINAFNPSVVSPATLLVSSKYKSTVTDYGAAYGPSTPHQITFSSNTNTFQDPIVLGSPGATVDVSVPNPAAFCDLPPPSTSRICGILVGESTNPEGWPDRFLATSHPNRARYQEIQFLKQGASVCPLFALQYRDPRTGDWVPYQSFQNNKEMTFNTTSSSRYPNSGISTATVGSTGTQFTNINAMSVGYPRLDPRGSRFYSLAFQEMVPTPGFSMWPDAGGAHHKIYYQAIQNGGGGAYQYGYYSGAPIQMGSRWTYPPSAWNNYQSPNDLVDNRQRPGDYYSVIRGRDQILRPADGDSDRGVYPTISTSSVGRVYLQNIAGASSTIAARINPSRLDDRPVMLNRPFQSVGELGYVFTDMPWKTLNLSSSVSAESGLLDLFCINETPAQNPVRAGTVNLNSVSQQVLSAILVNTTKPTGAPISQSDADAIALDFVTMREATPLTDRGDLVLNFYAYLEGNSKIQHVSTPSPYSPIKTRNEAIARALAEIGTTRTWNLLIDVVAQSGKFPPPANDLDDFQVQGERRYWLHLAIDRATGRVVDQFAETVIEN